MKSNYDAAIAWVLRDEGGYAERDTEGGGAVNMGVTFTVFTAWRLKKKKPAPAFPDLKAMDVSEAREIYRAQYADGTGFDDMPTGVDYVVLDAAVNGGVTGAIKVLQRALKLKQVDGHYGLVARWAANHREPSELIRRICADRLATYQKMSRFNHPYKEGKTRTWGDIWTARIKLVEKRALAMVKE